jgi:DNA polymerase elongation subunit (family B)
MSKLKILTLDIETAPNLVYTWGLWNQNISIDNIVEPTYMLCWAAKWAGKKRVYYRDYDDEDFLTLIHELIEEADAVVTYNGMAFDIKHLHREFIEAGLPPPEPHKDLDLVKTVRSRFKYPSNKLDYVASRLLDEKKDEAGKNYKLWLDCMLGDADAWADMKRYNIQDVLLTEKLYFKLRGWIKNHPNHGLYVEDSENPVCRNCGGTHIHRKGIEATNVRAYQRFKCQDCGANLRGRVMVKGGKKSPWVLS